MSHSSHISLCSQAVAQVLEVAFGQIHVCSILTVVILPYIAPAFAKVLEVAFGKFHVLSSLTVVIFPCLATAVAQLTEVAVGKIHIFQVPLSSYFLM